MPDSSNSREIQTQVTKATVFTDRAILLRSGTATLEAGKQTILLSALPDKLNEDSVRVNGRGTGKLLIEDFKIERKHYREVPEERIQTLIDGKESLLLKKKGLQDEAEVIVRQEEFLGGIGKQSSETISQHLKLQSPSVEEWRSVLQFLGSEGKGLKEQARKLEEEIKAVQKEINLIDKTLQGVANAKGNYRKVVAVEVEIASAGDFAFEVSYMVHNAHWKPLYDARVDARTKEVSLRYFGAVTQRTGEDWNDVQVLLSTARPHIGGNAPQLYEWHLGFYEELMDSMVAVASPAPMPRRKKMSKTRSVMKEEAAFGGMMEEEAEVQSAEVVGGEGASVVFSPPAKSDIPGNGSTGKLLIMESPMGAEFQYLAVPKLAQHVYLTAKVKNETEFPLLPGAISIFLDGNFVGKSRLQELITSGERFELSLGVDEAIKVKHQLKRKFGDEKGLFTKSKVTQFAYQIDLHNQHDRAETITVRDQIPVSQEDDIKVKLESVEPGENPDKNMDELPGGSLEWKVEVGAREKAKIEFSFSVSHARDAKIVGL